jgi:hypothetical protein
MAGADSNHHVLRGVQDGDLGAVEPLFERYAQRLARLSDRHLRRKMAAHLDREDMVQSVFRTFFHRSARGEFQIEPHPLVPAPPAC